jgi:hypothetical protein
LKYQDLNHNVEVSCGPNECRVSARSFTKNRGFHAVSSTVVLCDGLSQYFF